MVFFIHCRRCGHSNEPNATTCAVCHRPLVVGTQNGMHCPVCGALSSAGTESCPRCGTNLVEIEQVPEAQRTLGCSYCHRTNPPLRKNDAAVYCIHCGHQLRLPGTGYSVAYLSPRSIPKGSGSKDGPNVSRLSTALEYLILFSLGLAALLLPGLPTSARLAVVLLFWLGVPIVLIAMGARARLQRRPGNPGETTSADRPSGLGPVGSSSTKE